MKKKSTTKSKISSPKAKSPKPLGYVFGRPTLYKAEFCQMLIKHMSEKKSFDSFAGVVYVSRDSLYEWLPLYPDFSDAKKIGESLRILATEELYLETMSPTKKKKFFTSGYLLGFFTKNVLNWSDNVKHSGDKDNPPIAAITLNYKLDPNKAT